MSDQNLRDIFECNLEIVEGTSDKAGNSAILGKVRGQFFVPDGTSRNRRFYSRSLWEKQIGRPEVQSRLKDRRMFGTISHEQPLNDTALMEGKVSHIVTDLHIDDQGRGIGEAIILDTPAGRILNTVLRAGGKLFVSSRAAGKFKGERNGIPMVDEDNYILSTFDYVLEPGFLEANPQLAESYNSVFNSSETSEPGARTVNQIDEKLIRENQDLRNDVKGLSEAKVEGDKALALANAKVADLTEKLAESSKSAAALDEYKKLGTAEEISKALELAKAKNEGLEKELKNLTSQVEAFAAVGTIEEMKKVIEKAAAFREELASYKELGTVAQFDKALTFVEGALDERDASKRSSEIEALATELKVSKEFVEKFYGKLSVEEIKEAAAALRKDEPVSENKKPGADWKAPKDDGAPITEKKKPKGNFAVNVMESMSSYRAPKD